MPIFVARARRDSNPQPSDVFGLTCMHPSAFVKVLQHNMNTIICVRLKDAPRYEQICGRLYQESGECEISSYQLIHLQQGWQARFSPTNVRLIQFRTSWPLHRRGINHERLTYRVFEGEECRVGDGITGVQTRYAVALTKVPPRLPASRSTRPFAGRKESAAKAPANG